MTREQGLGFLTPTQEPPVLEMLPPGHLSSPVGSSGGGE